MYNTATVLVLFVATNFSLAGSDARARLRVARYAALDTALGAMGGAITPAAALGLLADVAQHHTRWSIVYGLASGEIRLAMGRRYDQVSTFDLGPGG